MKTLKVKIVKFIWAVFFAWGFFWFSIIIFNNVAARSMIATMALNFALIIAFLIEDAVADYFYAKKKPAEQSEPPGLFKRMINAYFTSVSFKTALYLFYIAILIWSAIDTVEPELFNEDISLYLTSVEYGILVLVAADNFLQLFLKDVAKRSGKV